MNPSEHTEEKSLTRAQVWERIESAALKYHKLTQTHGVYTRIAEDVGRSSQTVADWKSGRSPVPKHAVTRLSEVYGVSAAYLLCLVDTPNPPPDLSQRVLRERMDEMVNQVIDRVNVEVPARAAIQMCDTALTGLLEGRDEAYIYGALFMQVMDLPHS